MLPPQWAKGSLMVLLVGTEVVQPQWIQCGGSSKTKDRSNICCSCTASEYLSKWLPASTEILVHHCSQQQLGSQPRPSTTEEWLWKRGFKYMMKFFSAIKNKVMSAGRWWLMPLIPKELRGRVCGRVCSVHIHTRLNMSLCNTVPSTRNVYNENCFVLR